MGFLKLFGRLHLTRITKLERHIGYKLAFPSPSQNWISGWVRFNLSKSWQRFGLNVIGLNYFTVGALDNRLSTRFDREAKQYQSWLGAYLVKTMDHRELSIQDHLNLAVVDQLNWLSHYGDPRPVCDLEAANFREIRNIRISGYKARVYEGGGTTHSDIGSTSKLLRLKMAFMAAVFNLSNTKLSLGAQHFIPTRARVKPYECIFIRGYIITIKIERDVYAVLFGNGAVVHTSRSKRKDTFPLLQEDILTILNAVQIRKLPS